jgi:REP element-mobilizing transposase RayT
MNRGVARRVIFPDAPAKRRFIALIACSVRRGEMHVEALVVMDTHFHLLASAPDGRIHYPMMRVLNAYARYFNRRYKRDGSPFRGRFRSIPILSDRHWFSLIRYIDFNPVTAKLAATPAGYPYGTACLYMRRRSGPAWLERSAVEERVRSACSRGTYSGSGYQRMFGIPPTEGETEVLERRVRRPACAHDDLAVIDQMPAGRIAAWMRRKAKLAEGLSPWSPIVGSKTVIALVDKAKADGDLLRTTSKKVARRADLLLTAGLLHDAAGMSLEEVGRRVGCAASTAGRRLRAHREALRTDTGYALLAGKLVREALDATYPGGAPS